jgi:hypothetical protein
VQRALEAQNLLISGAASFAQAEVEEDAAREVEHGQGQREDTITVLLKAFHADTGRLVSDQLPSSRNHPKHS